ncbi:DUF4822 domain-containing protein [Leucobacter luti]|uniref:DUF4822 domain-containing protein n=1 Tax=Leucobacter luti TaxID=340320 RepID=UPI001C691902|nr:DUF4822 domain-containing protein [Leucobacter luti]QYM74677.1 DUF4822 domain-containing protein [Leucobacter luti]
MCLLPAAGAFAAAAPAGAAASAASPFGAAAASTAAPAAAVSEALTPSEVLASTPWETTSAVDQDGNPVALDNPAVSNFVGWAYYNVNGTFTMYNLDDTPKMHGDWSVSEGGTSRTITARDADGNPLFTRVVPITVLTGDEFTYRVIPDAATPDVYYDIVHTPTDHAEPGTINYSEVLASTPWETTSAVDQDGNPVALDNPAVSNFVGWAYYNVNGTFTMYNLDDTPKMHGDWSVSEDGTSRTITARDADGNPLFTRVVPITVLTGDEFTYRVIPDAAVPGAYYDIVHTPTDHAEPNPGTTDPGTTDPGTTDPGTTDPGTTDPGTTNPGTTNPGSTNPGTTDPAPAPSAPGAKTPSALAVTGAGSPAIAGVVGGVLAVLGGAAAFVVRLVRRAA